MPLPFQLDCFEADDPSADITGYSFLPHHGADFGGRGEMAMVEGEVELDDGNRIPVVAWMTSATYADIAYSSLQALEATDDAVQCLGAVATRVEVIGRLELAVAADAPNVLLVVRSTGIDVCVETSDLTTLVDHHPILSLA